jgi:hypothetical protein
LRRVHGRLDFFDVVSWSIQEQRPLTLTYGERKMFIRFRRKVLIAGMALAGLCGGLGTGVVRAGSITYITPAGSSTGGGPVDAMATFTTSANTLSIVLSNLQANPTDVAQLLSDLSFTVGNGGSLTGATLASSSGQEITVASDGTFTLGSTVATGWVPTLGGTSGNLDVLGAGGAGPTHLIIGPPGPGGTYSNANGSIAGNKAHNPFLNQSATFSISGSGINAGTTITSVTFSFGTTSGIDVAGVPSVPEPSSIVMAGIGIGVVSLIRLRRRRSQPD